jgi:hypothetical protein
MLLALASSVFLGSESRGTHNHILLSQIRDCPNLESQVPIFIFPRNRVAQLYTRPLGCLFVALDSQDYGADIEGRERVTLRLAVYRQLIRLGAKPLEFAVIK